MNDEDEAADYRQQAGEEAWQAFLERRAMMGGPEAPEPCEECDGKRVVTPRGTAFVGGEEMPCHWLDDCPRCLGTKVQP